MRRIRKKLVVAVIGELVLTVLMQYIPQNIYAKSDKTVKTAFENYVSGTLVPMYGVLMTGLQRILEVYFLHQLWILTVMDNWNF